MLGNEFYNETLRKYVTIFGTLFNDIHIDRDDSAGTQLQRIKVPIQYGPKEKFLVRITDQPDLGSGRHAAYLPRMSFEIVAVTYDPQRKQNQLNKRCKQPTSATGVISVSNPVPYNIDFQLSIMTKYTEDGTRIIEQILPFFQPQFVVTADMLPTLGISEDIPIILNAVSLEDTYEGAYEERRAIIWTLDFTIKGYFYGKVSTSGKLISKVISNFFELGTNDELESVTVTGTLNANGSVSSNTVISSGNTSTSNTTTANVATITTFGNIVTGRRTAITDPFTTFDSFDDTEYRSATYQVQITDDDSNKTTYTNLNLTHNKADAFVVPHGTISSNEDLVTFDVALSSNTVSVKVSPVANSVSISYMRFGIYDV